MTTLARLIESLPANRQAEHYRQIAKEALLKAYGATGKETRAEFLSLSASWRALADEMDHLNHQKTDRRLFRS
jgi:hypothetical protein